MTPSLKNTLKALQLALLAVMFAGASVSLAQTPTPGAFDDIVAKSNGLSAEQKASARQKFSIGFKLWQDGDLASAALAFAEGLEIDPANPQANFYLGDSLRRTNNRQKARAYLERAAALGADTPEGFKAKAALSEIATATPSIAELSKDELTEMLAGRWALMDKDDYAFTLSKTPSGELSISGGPNCFFCAGKYEKLSVEGKTIRFSIGDDHYYTLSLVNNSRMEGNQTGMMPSPMFATKR